MLIGRIIGTVTATRKDEALTGAKLLITQPVDVSGNENDSPVIAVDTVGAGVGETVLYISGSVAPFALKRKDIPVDAAIVGIIDRIDIAKA